MKKLSAFSLASFALALVFLPNIAMAATCDQGRVLRASLVSLNSSRINGGAVLCVGKHGVNGDIVAENLMPGNVYTVWFFFAEGSVSSSPGRFDSTIAPGTSGIFSGHVGGLRPTSGATITLLMFGHGAASSLDDVSLATNLLTPMGGSAVAVATITIP